MDVGLRLGAQIAAGLAAIHDQGVTHCAIHPGNVVIDLATWTAKLIDFAAASVLPERAEASPLDVGVMPLSYVSPEQTGWMNRKIDHRTDLYSLGATLYHAFAGHPPFAEVDPLAIAHAHVARPHRPLASIDPSIPTQVSNIVDRLLAKTPENRYQSARGVLADLDECTRQYRASANVVSFPLGRADLSEKFLIPQKLYGRSAERAQLLEAFAEVTQGKKILFLVGGYAGTGKSSLVNELQAPVLERRGLFASGKFDPLARHAPYSALVQALTQLCRYLLGLPEDELTKWKKNILEALSSNAGLMLDIVPELERVLGPQPPVPTTGLVESEHRFALTLTRLLSVFARHAHPLVLFLDDLQWADPATLHALTRVLRLPELTHLLVIGAYRDNEVSSDHPLAIKLDELSRGGPTELRRVTLEGLTADEMSLLVADTVCKRPAAVRDFAQLVVEKTSGNPFFAGEFLRTLHEERLLQFSSEERAWTWDLKKIEDRGLTPNVVDLVLRKLERLPETTSELVRFAAAAGNRFDLELLASAVGVTPAVARARLAPAIRERLVVPLDARYPIGLVDVSSASVTDCDNYQFRFLHDRVQQAAYESWEHAARPAVHLRLGRILAARASSETRGDGLFDVVDQLNRGAELMLKVPERLELARLNLAAGDRARRTTAYNEARQYLGRGMALLPADAWSEHYALAAALHLHYAESTYLSGQFAEAGAFSDDLLPMLRMPVEKAELYAIRIVVETARGQFGRAVELSRQALAMLGHPAPLADPAAILAS
ncbi:MAG TPA: AAA family ATPase, partial [Polyangiaceae bacterium]|nr:AAA family ATPase [Polyangiaceae bacterium]